LLLALSPVSVTAQSASGASELSTEAVRARLQEAGYATGAPSKWDDNALVIEARAIDGRVVRAIVYSDSHTAAVAHRRAYAQWASSSSLPYSDEVGPQLLSGFGASAWRHNVALVQSSPAIFGALMPPEVDCTDLSPPPPADLSRREYGVDASVIALVEQLP
jgi:hypothetical protein